jgi:hypothetical protein
MKRAALYVRVSTDRQTVENQIARLTEIAMGRGWQIVQTFSDAGISGAKGRNERPGFDQMLKQAQRQRFDVVMVWAIDRIGRSLIDLLGTIQHLEACGVDLYLDQQAIASMMAPDLRLVAYHPASGPERSWEASGSESFPMLPGAGECVIIHLVDANHPTCISVAEQMEAAVARWERETSILHRPR